MRMGGCPAGDVGEGVVESLDHQFGNPAIVTWVEADPPATVEVVGGGDDRSANGDRLPNSRILGSDSHALGERNAEHLLAECRRLRSKVHRRGEDVRQRLQALTGDDPGTIGDVGDYCGVGG